jgi:CelD/BcsL family acetyltransferase involved in cellulose biosynthesis
MARYSPGALLLLEVLRSAADSGARHFDFGKDLSTYKRRYMTGAITLLAGQAETSAIINRLSHCRNVMEHWGKQSAIRVIARYPGRALKRLERRRRYG